MADYSWVVLKFKSTDAEVVEAMEDLFGVPDTQNEIDGWTSFEGERSYGLAEECEAYLIEHGIAYRRWSDGKYEYDGDESHWQPGMAESRTFTRLNNGGRAYAEPDFEMDKNLSDEQLGEVVRNYFEFEVK